VPVLLEQDVAQTLPGHDAFPAQRGMEFRQAKVLVGEILPQEPAVTHQDRRGVLDDAPERLGPVRHPRHDGVHREDGRGAVESAAE
jgi:hypothetical protein